MALSWEPDDFKHNEERSSNAGDATVVLLRDITGSVGGSHKSSLGETSTSQRRVLFDFKPFGISGLRDVTSSVQGGSVSYEDVTTEFLIKTESSASSVASLLSAERGRYVASFELWATVALRIPQAPVGEQVFSWGYFDDSDGFYFGQDITGTFVSIQNSGTLLRKVYQSDWNVDKLDGSGSSGYDLSQFADSGHIYTNRFLWHGYGLVEWVVSTFGTNNEQLDVTVHRERITGSVSISNPNLPVGAKIENNATAQSASIFLTCRSVSINGDTTPVQRFVSERVLSASVNTDFTPLISFKRSLTENITTNIQIKEVEFLSDANILWEIRLNSTLTGSSFSVPSTTIASETKLVSDISATGSSGGIYIVGGFAEGGAGSKRSTANIVLPRQDFVEDQPITLAVRTIAGNGTVNAILTVEEEW